MALLPKGGVRGRSVAGRVALGAADLGQGGVHGRHDPVGGEAELLVQDRRPGALAP